MQGSIAEMIDAINVFYNVGGRITDSSNREYKLKELIHGIANGPGNRLTRKHGIREKCQELRTEQETFELNEQEILVCDEWIKDQCTDEVLQNAHTLRNRLTELTLHHPPKTLSIGRNLYRIGKIREPIK